MQVAHFTSGIWQTQSSVIAGPAGAIVIDPAYFPRELEAIAAAAAAMGGAAAVVFTHGHWDHVMGHQAFAEAPVWMSQTLARDIEAGNARAAAHLEEARAFDSRWYVPRPGGHLWPAQRHALGETSATKLAGLDASVLALPGHSEDGLGLWVGDTLWVGDYLSPCEIPFVDDHAAYAQTLRRLRGLLTDADGPRVVVPGHGPVMTANEARAIAEADLGYLEALRDARDAASAHAVPLPRAASVVGMREHHEANIAKLRWSGGA